MASIHTVHFKALMPWGSKNKTLHYALQLANQQMVNQSGYPR
jgi:hypothetical protein